RLHRVLRELQSQLLALVLAPFRETAPSCSAGSQSSRAFGFLRASLRSSQAAWHRAPQVWWSESMMFRVMLRVSLYCPHRLLILYLPHQRLWELPLSLRGATSVSRRQTKIGRATWREREYI